MGKTLLLNTIAACHAAASLSAEPAHASFTSSQVIDSGFIKGAILKRDYDRIITVRLRDFRKLDGDDSPFAVPGISVADAVALAVAELLGLASAIEGSTAAEFSSAFFDSVAPRTLWLLDGFDEAPSAEGLARALAVPVNAAFQEARVRKLAAPCNAASERSFHSQLASGVPPSDRLEAVLRVLLTQQNVIVSSRPQFESHLAPLTGRSTARYVRLEPLAPKAVQAFVREALKVRD